MSDPGSALPSCEAARERPRDAAPGQRLNVCLVAHNAYGVLARKDTGHVGGIEVQVPTMARWLAQRGHRVAMITWNDGGSDGEVIDGVAAFKLCRRDQGLPGLRFLMPRWTSLHAALDRAGADLVYYNCGDMGLGQVALWSRIRGRRLVYSVSSDVDCVRDLPNLRPLRERVLYRFGLRRADRIIVQTSRQQALLREEFGLRSQIISMPSRGFGPAGDRSAKFSGMPKRVLWAGRFNPEKRLDMLLDLAQRHPEVAFDVVGEPNQDTAYARDVTRRARGVANVELHGRVSHDRMGNFYRRAALLCCTSTYEGFPNVFIEAWSAGVPVITTFDPDSVISTNGLGGVAADLGELDAALGEMLAPEPWLAASLAAERYYLAHHTVEASLPRFEQAFLEVVAAPEQPAC
jgi:glycosyltransferase involved in cell wall biosynthesis